jgi:hypothetical protein
MEENRDELPPEEFSVWTPWRWALATKVFVAAWLMFGVFYLWSVVATFNYHPPWPSMLDRVASIFSSPRY